jgi:hypothetical protein
MVMKIIKDVNRRFFESKLAEFVLDNHDAVPAVQKVSDAILLMLIDDENREEIIRQIASNDKIKQDLYSESMFGRLIPRNEDAPVIFAKMIDVLINHDDLSQVMHIHALFAYRIFEHLPKRQLLHDFEGEADLSTSQRYTRAFNLESEKTNRIRIHSEITTKTRHTHSVLKDRGRVRKEGTVERYAHVGYELPLFFKRKMRASVNHILGGRLWARDVESCYSRMLEGCDASFVAGVSGHTLTFIRGLFLYGDLDKEQLREYALGIFAYLGGGGNHSFHEVMTVMHIVADVDYVVGEYTRSLPRTLFEHESFERELMTYRFDWFFEKSSPEYSKRRWTNIFADIRKCELLTV